MNKQFCRVGLGEKGHKSGWNGVILLFCEAKNIFKELYYFCFTICSVFEKHFLSLIAKTFEWNTLKMKAVSAI